MPNDPPPQAREANETLAAPAASATDEPIYLLQVVEGPDRGRTLILDGQNLDRANIGQSTICEMQLTDPMVSRRHASIARDKGALRVVDLGSTNGILVNDLRVYDATLRGGETLRLGGSVLRVTRAGVATAGARVDLDGFGTLVGKSAEMRRLYPLLARLAASSIPVVVEGEVGTGKEAVAESLHLAGPRAGGSFVVFDCACTPARAVDAVLFGEEERGHEPRLGLFEQADGGTLLLDEVAELDLALQARLLRVIERGEVQRVGSTTARCVDVRVLASSRHDLDREVQSGRLREDLFYRLAVARVELPPLRRRHGDVAALAAYFWQRLGGDPGGPPKELLIRFADYEWPGNVRELENAIARRLALGADVEQASNPSMWQRPAAAPEAVSSAEAAAPPRDVLDEVLDLDLPLPRARQKVVEELERRFVSRTLAKHGGNVTRAAAASGLALRYFQVLKARSSR